MTWKLKFTLVFYFNNVFNRICLWGGGLVVHLGLCWVYVALDGEAATRDAGDATRDAGDATRDATRDARDATRDATADATRDAGDATRDAPRDALFILCIQARMCSFK